MNEPTIVLPRRWVESLVSELSQPFVDGEYNRCIYCESSKRSNWGTGPIIHDSDCVVRLVQERLQETDQ